MFYETRIFDQDGKIKQVVSRADLSKAFWDRINQEEKDGRFDQGKEKGLSPRLKKKLQAAFPELYYLSG